MKKKSKSILFLIAGIFFFLTSCNTTPKESTSSSSSNSNAVAPKIITIVCNAASSTSCNPAWVFDGSEHFNFTINSDISMSELTVVVKDLGSTDCSVPVVINPSNTTGSLTVNLNCIPVGNIYPWIKVCGSIANCNSYEYNAAYPNFYYQAGVGVSAVPMVLY
ncbi:MAG: hypothetical protein OEV78_04360 [Spirochaetia bacterium]|nr:hypothetical protein [Spirochaetia bacterium]